MLTELFGWFKGKSAEYINPSDLLSKNEGREISRVASQGTVKIQF